MRNLWAIARIVTLPPFGLLARSFVERVDEVGPPLWQWRIENGVEALGQRPLKACGRGLVALLPRHVLVRNPRVDGAVLRRKRGQAPALP